jgi:hypothetical protein
MTKDALHLLGRHLQSASRRERWYADPVAFAEECITWVPGDALAPYQRAALSDLASSGRLAIRAPHGAGKSVVAAIAVLWWACTREARGDDWKVLTTASSWHVLIRYLWPEAHIWSRRLRFDILGITPWQEGRQLFDLSIKLDHGQAFAAASSDPSLLEGAHAAELLLVIDEAKAVEPAVWDALEGALSGPGQAMALATSTPGAPAGRFWEISMRRPGLQDWGTRHFTLAEAIAADRIGQAWADQRALQWGAESAVYQNRVLGEFADGEADGVVPLSWVEAAVERWHEWEDAGRPDVKGRRVIGVDVASTGSDKTVLVTRQGNVVTAIERYSKADSMATTGRVAAKLNRLTHPGSIAVVDVIGVGDGMVSRLREQQLPVVAFNSSQRATGRDRTGELGFLNRRAEAWWKLRELLDPAFGSQLALPDDDELIGDLTAPGSTFTSAGKVQIESKDEIRKRLGRSPDVGDAVAMAFSVSGSGSGDVELSPVPYSDAPPSRDSGVVPWATTGSELFPDPDSPTRGHTAADDRWPTEPAQKVRSRW